MKIIAYELEFNDRVDKLTVNKETLVNILTEVETTKKITVRKVILSL